MTTIQDIADKMGISKSAVSKALNNAPDISENLRKQVLETAVALGYTKLRRYRNSVRKICVLVEKDNIHMKNLIILHMISLWDSGSWRSHRDLML